MFGIGGTELLVILVVALIVLGPKSVPQIARTLGKAMGEFRRVSTDFQRTLNTEIELDEHEKRKQEAEQELFGTPKPEATASAPVAAPAAAAPSMAKTASPVDAPLQSAATTPASAATVATGTPVSSDNAVKVSG